MFEAQYPFNPEDAFSPWFPRQGDNVLCTLIPITGGKLVVQLFTKNTQDAGDGTDADSSSKIDTNTIGQTIVPWKSGASRGLLQLCRYKFSWDGGSARAPGTAQEASAGLVRHTQAVDLRRDRL